MRYTSEALQECGIASARQAVASLRRHLRITGLSARLRK